MNHTFDVIVVGAGYIGSSIAYHLCQAGLKTALFDRASMAAGASRANYGNIQIQDTELEKSVLMINLARTRFATLEDELDWKVGLKKIGALLLIENENQKKILAERLKIVNAAGIRSELIDQRQLKEVEPSINAQELLGALYYPDEGQLDPFQLIWGYLLRGRQHGLQEYYYHEVTNFMIENGHIRGIVTPQGKFYAGNVILCTGAYTHSLGLLLGRQWNADYILGQAVVTESIGPTLHNHIASASFFEQGTQAPVGKVQAITALSQSVHGNLLLGEAMFEADHFERQVPQASLPSIASCILNYFPSFQKLNILRCWSAPVAGTADGCPLLGPVMGIQGLFLATAFRSTVVITPLMGDIMKQLITQGRCDLEIEHFSPERNLNHAF